MGDPAWCLAPTPVPTWVPGPFTATRDWLAQLISTPNALPAPPDGRNCAVMMVLRLRTRDFQMMRCTDIVHADRALADVFRPRMF